MNPIVSSDAASSKRLANGWPAAIGGALVLLLVSAWLYHLQVVRPPWGNFQTDLPAHLAAAQQFWEGKHRIVHPGFHLITLFLSHGTGWTLGTSAVIILTAATLASYWVTLLILTSSLSQECSGSQRALLALVLSLVSAVYLPLFSPNIYLGQGTPNIWHSPTWIAAQPLALLGFFWTGCWCQVENRKSAVTSAFIISLLLAISTVFKPSFAVAFIPAFGLFALGRVCLKKQPVSDLFSVAGMVAPALLVMALQYVGRYDQADGSGPGIVWWAPLAVWSRKTSSIPISTLLTLAFPLSVLITHSRRLCSEPSFCVAWILVGVAFLQRAILAETGAWMMDGNWGWGYMFALKIVFIYSVIAVFVARKPTVGVSVSWWWLPLVLLSLHLGSGLIYLYRLLTGVGFS